MINPTNFYTVQGWMLADLNLKGTELAAYAIIYGFSQDGKSEYAGSSAYLCEWLGCTKKTALTTLASLTEKGYLKKREIIQNGVKLCAYVAVRTPQKQAGQPGEEITPGRCKNYTGGGEEITPGRCKNYTGGGEEITPNNKLDNIAISNIKYIVEYLNKKAGTKYKPTSKETQKHINARLAEGYTVADFVQVIDKKCAAWKGDAKMEEYLRPATLFGTKFEGYLNARQPRPGLPAVAMVHRLATWARMVLQSTRPKTTWTAFYERSVSPVKHRKFVKQLMAAGMSRNNAEECAALAADARRPLYWVLGDLLNHHRGKFQQRHVLDDRRVRTAIIHGTNSFFYALLYGRIGRIYEVSLVAGGGKA